ncbi:papain-like cysteine protease family protein [Sphingomonas sp. T9W2]|uniref:papain-like cysteine protease family protein n=1 Tax=Sphingomonas sp. T9W2 TaxID=3143183 RepID=UPI0031F4AB99
MKPLQASFPNRQIGALREVHPFAAPIAVDFVVESQGHMTNWCWAAVTSSISRYYPAPPGKSQCEVARMEVGAQLHVDCCVSPGACDVTWYLDLPLQHVGHFHARAGSWVQPAAVAAELQAHNPLPVRVEWRSGGSHFLAIYGMQDLGGGTFQLWLTDSIFGVSSISGVAFVNGGYQAAGGRWADSYSVKP